MEMGGNLEYVGRKDQQVKIRGYRIELGEIEAILWNTEGSGSGGGSAGRGRREETGGVCGGAGRGERSESGELRRYLQGRLPEYMVPGMFVKLERMPLTANGKVDRRNLPAPERGTGRGYGGREEKRKRCWRGSGAGCWVLERVGREDNFFELGGDSILSIQVVARASQGGLRILPRQIFERQTIAELAQVAEERGKVEAEQGVVSGKVPLLPIQRRFFEVVTEELQHYNQALFLETEEEWDWEKMKGILRKILAHHDELRVRFRKEGEEWEQWIAQEEEVERVMVWKDLRDVPDQELRGRLEEEAGSWQRSLDLEEGPVMRVVWFECGEGRANRVLWIIHHLAVDGVSWRILIEDFERLWGVDEKDKMLPLKTTSYKRWAEELEKYGRNGLGREEIEYWERLEESERLGEGEEGKGEVRVLRTSLNADETQAMLQEVPGVYRTQINDVLLTALSKAFQEIHGHGPLRVDLEGHGREEIVEGVDISRTVGWFTSLYPVRLELPKEGDIGDELKSIKEQLRGVPGRGLGYGLWRYGRGRRGSEEQRGICFNYLGQFDQTLKAGGIFRPAREGAGPLQDSRNKRTHRLEINGGISGGCLGFHWSYSKEHYDEATMERLANKFQSVLKGIIEHCRSSQSIGYTPSDFPPPPSGHP